MQVDACKDPDIIKAVAAGRKTTVCISAINGDGIEDLMDLISLTLREAMVRLHILVPYSRSDLVEEIHRKGVVHSIGYTETGTELVAHVPPILAARLTPLLSGNIP